MASNRGEIDRRVVRAAEAALAKRKFVTAIDVLVGVGWLEPRRVDEWRQGRVDYLERVTVANLGKISTAMRSFRRWAQARGLRPSETAYVARTRDRRPLRFSKSGDAGIERVYRTHWVPRAPASASATLSTALARTSSCRRGWPRRSCACFPAVLQSERDRSRATPPFAVQAGSGARPPGGRWSRRRSSWPWSPRSATRTLA